mgnify:CR=1 FL=1
MKMIFGLKQEFIGMGDHKAKIPGFRAGRLVQTAALRSMGQTHPKDHTAPATEGERGV